MAADLDAYRRFFAQEIQMASNLRTSELVDALATVPREKFLPPGPWVVRGDADMMAPLRKTPSDDPRFIYHNIAVGIDPARMLFNGAPGMVASAIDALGLKRGSRVMHVGAGAGYYTAVIAETVGPTAASSASRWMQTSRRRRRETSPQCRGSRSATLMAASRSKDRSTRSCSTRASRIPSRTG